MEFGGALGKRRKLVQRCDKVLTIGSVIKCNPKRIASSIWLMMVKMSLIALISSFFIAVELNQEVRIMADS